MKIQSVAFAVIVGTLGMISFNASAQANLKTVAVLNKDKTALVGKTVSAQGKVVKVNNGRYFTSGTQAKTLERALQVTDYLIGQVRSKAK